MFGAWHSPVELRQEMNRLQQEMSRLFDRWGGNGSSRMSAAVVPPLNLWEDENNLYIEAELPGLGLDDLEIYVAGENKLSLRGNRKPPEPANGTWHRRERGFGEFSRIVELPSPVDSDKVSARFQHGVLVITLPKREEAKPRRITVKANA
jgi:HSP20 family protein